MSRLYRSLSQTCHFCHTALSSSPMSNHLSFRSLFTLSLSLLLPGSRDFFTSFLVAVQNKVKDFLYSLGSSSVPSNSGKSTKSPSGPTAPLVEELTSSIFSTLLLLFFPPLPPRFFSSLDSFSLRKDLIVSTVKRFMYSGRMCQTARMSPSSFRLSFLAISSIFAQITFFGTGWPYSATNSFVIAITPALPILATTLASSGNKSSGNSVWLIFLSFPVKSLPHLCRNLRRFWISSILLSISSTFPSSCIRSDSISSSACLLLISLSSLKRGNST
mmetsp:Transcript_17971/g.26727  ORF Transcript_17971/g.26727 Transcript_17971/m.26727 type:complete len:274 (-) Transcript_17971:1910-2731(-)